MNKVVSANLGGNAYQLEEKAYAELHKYLESARKKLADDPDKDEILADFERTIAEKCNAHLHDQKTVITEHEIAKIIREMGPVEPAKTEEDADNIDAESTQPKRLYTLREGSLIGGVCNGIAAYLNIDVTVVRLIFVLLAFLSSGIVVLVYLMLMLLLPEAKTLEQKAELRGEKFSAQDVLKRAKQKYAEVSDPEHWQEVADNAKPALNGFGHLLQALVRFAAMLVVIVLTIGVAFLTALWIGSLWWLAFAHPHFVDQLSTIGTWQVMLGLSALYLCVIVPLLFVSYIFEQLRDAKKKSLRARWIAGMGAVWIIAAGALLGVTLATAGRVHDFQQSHGYINIDGHHNVCINSDLCNDPTKVEAQHFYQLQNGHLEQVR